MMDGQGDLASVAPLGRWDVDDHRCIIPSHGSAGAEAAGLSPPRFGCFMSGVELFDGTLFGVSSSEAATMDPQQRFLLQV